MAFLQRLRLPPPAVKSHADKFAFAKVVICGSNEVANRGAIIRINNPGVKRYKLAWMKVFRIFMLCQAGKV